MNKKIKIDEIEDLEVEELDEETTLNDKYVVVEDKFNGVNPGRQSHSHPVEEDD
jgi:hypothetical protein